MDNKQAVLRKLRGKHNVQCPKCKSEIFYKKTIEKTKIVVNEEYTEDDYIEYIDTEEYRCCECNRKLREGEMI